MMLGPQEQKVLDCKVKSMSQQKDQGPYHFKDFVNDVIMPQEEVCSDAEPVVPKPGMITQEEQAIDAVIDKQLKEALEKVSNKE